jgi:hypothetical protein
MYDYLYAIGYCQQLFFDKILIMHLPGISQISSHYKIITPELREHHLDRVIKIIAARLEQKGIESIKIPSYIEAVANLLFLRPDLDNEELNMRMQSIGWQHPEIDEHTFKLLKLVSDKYETRPVLR